MLSAEVAAQDPWSALHADSGHTGRAEGQGQITEPVVIWESPTGGVVRDEGVRLADLTGDGNPEIVTSVGRGLIARRLDGTLLWDTPSLNVNQIVAVADFTGDDRPEVLAGGRAFVMLDGRTGRLIWRFNDTADQLVNTLGTLLNVDADPEPELLMAVGARGGEPASLQLYDFGFGLGTAALVWKTTHESLPASVFRPAIGQLDPDNEGLEVAFINQNHCQLVVADMDTGLILGVVSGEGEGLTQGRTCFGLIEAVDVDGDGIDEVVFTGAGGGLNSSASVSVYDHGEGRLLWQREYGVDSAEHLTRATAGAVADVDADGDMELFIGVFNNGAELGEQDGVEAPDRWSLVAYDAATGETLGALIDHVPLGLVDTNGDGVPELLSQPSLPESARIPPFGTLEAWSLDADRAPASLWRTPNVRALTRTLEVPQINLRPLTEVPARFDPGDGGRSDLLVIHRVPEGEPSLQRLRVSGDRVEVAAEVAIEAGVSMSLLEQVSMGRTLAAIKTDIGEVRLLDGDLQQSVVLEYANHISGPPVLAPHSDGLRVLLRNSAQNVSALDPATGSRLSPPERRWQRESAINPIPRKEGHLLTLDLEGDGDYEIAQSGEGIDEVPFVELLSVEGERLWRRTFPEGRYAPTSLVAGQFGGDESLDLAMMLHRLDGIDLTLTVDGATGEILATHVSAVEEVLTSPNQTLLGLPDANDDGLHELLALHLVTFERLNGADLTRLSPITRVPSNTSRAPRSALIDRGEGPEGLFLNLFTTEKAVVDIETGEPRWTARVPSMDRQAVGFAGLSDANGDGVLDIAMAGSFGELVVLDGQTGDLIRSACLVGGQVRALGALTGPESCGGASPLSSVAVADIDGDGVEEYILGATDGWLYAINAEDGTMAWRLFLRFGVQAPVVGDIDGDGFLEILVTTADSRLVAVDEAGVGAITEVRDVFVNDLGQPDALAVDIDVSTRTDVFAVAWDPVPGATSYLFTLLTENLNQLIDWTPTDNPQTLISGLDLIPGQSYFASVVPLSGADQVGPTTTSDGVLIVGTGPQIIGFQALPNVFDPAEGERTTIKATVAALDGLQRVELKIQGMDNPASGDLFTFEHEPGEVPYELEVEWDGQNPAILPAGLYEARLFAIDRRGEATSDRLTIEIRFAPPVQEPEPPPPDIVIVERGGGCCGCGIHRRSPYDLPAMVVVLLMLAWMSLRGSSRT